MIGDDHNIKLAGNADKTNFDLDILVEHLKKIHPCVVMLFILLELLLGGIILRERNMFMYMFFIINFTIMTILYVCTVNCEHSEQDNMWYDYKKWLLQMAFPTVFIWIAMFLHHIFWDTSNFYEIHNKNIVAVLTSLAVIIVSYIGVFFNTRTNFKHYVIGIKWLVLICVFVLPLWRRPWYQENRFLMILRVLCFLATYMIYFKSLNNCFTNPVKTETSHIVILKCTWIVTTHPFLIVVSIGSVIIDVIYMYDKISHVSPIIVMYNPNDMKNGEPISSFDNRSTNHNIITINTPVVTNVKDLEDGDYFGF